MSENQQQPSTQEISVNAESSADDIKRDFIKRFGKYAASAPLGIFLLISSKHVAASGGSDAG